MELCQIPFERKRELELSGWLQSFIGVERFTPGLDRIRDVFSPFNLYFKERKIPVVIVGGTNGKGETVYTVGHWLSSMGKSVAVWSSPHVLSIRERFYFSKHASSYEELELNFKQSFTELKVKLSYYEFLFFNFLKMAQNRDVDVLILEVGLGGRFDTVNLLDPSVSAITSISRDHEEILGRGYRKILFEKLGISRPDISVITAFELCYCRTLAKKYLNDLGAIHLDLFDAKILKQSDGFRTRNRVVAREIYNCLAKSLDISSFDFVDDKFCSFKGRFEIVNVNGIEYHFASAHNIDGLRKMAKELLDKDYYFDSVLFSFSDRPQKELAQFVNIMKEWKINGNIKSMQIVPFSHSRAPSVDKVKSLSLPEIPFCEFKEIAKIAKMGTANIKKVFITGSYYFLGEVQKLLVNEFNAKL